MESEESLSLSALVFSAAVSLDEVLWYMAGWLGSVTRFTAAVPSTTKLDPEAEVTFWISLSTTYKSSAFWWISSRSVSKCGSTSVEPSSFFLAQ